MKFEKDVLLDITKGIARGDCLPFSSSSWQHSDDYLKQMTGRLKDIRSIELNADFEHYGSGFSSYVPIFMSKKDKSDVTITTDGDIRTETTNGLLLYLCRLAPVAVYGGETWTKTFHKQQWRSGSTPYLALTSIGILPQIDWTNEIVAITNILNEYRWSLLTKEEVDIKLDFDLTIPTVLAAPPYTVFDCLFYWEDWTAQRLLHNNYVSSMAFHDLLLPQEHPFINR